MASVGTTQSLRTPGGAAVALAGVHKHWDKFRAVNDISFAVPAGSFTVLLGPSGCGKTTCLRLIAGLETVTSGTIHIDGRDVTDVPPARRGVAMVFQSYALFPHLSAAENILFGLKARGVPKQEQARRLRVAADILGIETLLDRRPSQLSGGQQQRVALGRAIVAEAPVCLLDEPLSNLDARLRADMRAELVALQRRLGITMIYVTHDQTEAMSMADRVILLNQGRIEQEGTPAELYAQPDSIFVARFIGTPAMNLLPLGRAGNGLAVRGTEGPVLAPSREGDWIGGIRPETLVLSADGLALRLERAEYMGADTILHCRCGAEDLPVQIRAPGRVDRPAGNILHVAVPAGAVQIFDAGTGQRCREDAAVPTETVEL